MPAVPALLELSARTVANATSSSSAVKVICAFPVSGQYGAGSRILYYVLVITCIFARKADWLRNASLAGALVFPSVASIHGLVLASTHVNGAVDMDIFGAFQFCSIAILAAPLTVRLSRTYFYDPGRNIIFLWTILILAGLVALCVEFYRATPVDCKGEYNGLPITRGRGFPYGQTNCGLTCSEQEGPFSPLRGGAASEIFVIPVPTRLTFNAAMLLAAGLCIPAVLSLIFTWDKILEINWKRRQRQEENLDEPVQGANVTVGELKGINSVVRMFLSVVEVPVFGGAVITILGIGETNFFSPQVMYQTEPMASIGQWAPIAGTVLAALGSLYLLWFKEDKTPKEKSANCYHPSNHAQYGVNSDQNSAPGRASDILRSSEVVSDYYELGVRSTSPHDIRLIPTITQPKLESETLDTMHHRREDGNENEPTAGRPRVRQWFTQAANYLGNVAHQKLDTSDYNDKQAHRFPEIPGEPLRNPALQRVSQQYSELREQNSRTESTYAPSIISTSGLEGSSTPSAQASPRPETSPSRRPGRRDTLEVPTPVHIHRRTESH